MFIRQAERRSLTSGLIQRIRRKPMLEDRANNDESLKMEEVYSFLSSMESQSKGIMSSQSRDFFLAFFLLFYQIDLSLEEFFFQSELSCGN